MKAIIEISKIDNEYFIAEAHYKGFLIVNGVKYKNIKTAIRYTKKWLVINIPDIDNFTVYFVDYDYPLSNVKRKIIKE